MSDIPMNLARPILSGRILLPVLRWRRPGKQPAQLDIRSLPDHLKRDMGILDGNDPTGRKK